MAIRITSRTKEGKDKMNGDKGTGPKDLSVTNQIMNAYRKQNGKMKRFEGLEKSYVGGNPSDLRFCLNI